MKDKISNSFSKMFFFESICIPAKEFAPVLFFFSCGIIGVLLYYKFCILMNTEISHTLLNHWNIVNVIKYGLN